MWEWHVCIPSLKHVSTNAKTRAKKHNAAVLGGNCIHMRQPDEIKGEVRAQKPYIYFINLILRNDNGYYIVQISKSEKSEEKTIKDKEQA